MDTLSDIIFDALFRITKRRVILDIFASTLPPKRIYIYIYTESECLICLICLRRKREKRLIKFSQYLKQQVDRDDPIGDLAQDVRRDEKNILRYFAAPAMPNLSLKRLHIYMQHQFACSDALEALIDAYREWQALGNTYRATRDDARRSAGWLKLRFLVLQRDTYACQLCGRTAQDGVKLEVDHKLARARGGTDDIANLWTLCFDCNRGKRDRPLWLF